MGKELSHIIFAEQSAKSLEYEGKDPLLSVLQNFPQAFHFGAIAPDTFYYGVRAPFLEKGFACCGEKIHGTEGNDTSLPTLRMLYELKKNPDDPMFSAKLAFVCGFLTHIALDSVLHPFVYYLSGNYHHECAEERAKAITRHRIIESWLDLFFLQEASLSTGDCGYLAGIRGNSPANLALLRFFFEAFGHTAAVEKYLWKYLRRGYTVQMLLNSMYPDPFWGKMVGTANRMLKGRLNTFMALFYPWNYREIPPEIINCGYYRHPVTGEELSGDIKHLRETARRRSRDFLEAVRCYVYSDGNPEQLAEVIKGYSLSMGLVGVPATNAGYFDCLSMSRIWVY